MAWIRPTFLFITVLLVSLLFTNLLWAPHVDAANKGKEKATKKASRNTKTDDRFELALSDITVDVSNPKDNSRTQQEKLTYPTQFAKPLVVQSGDQIDIGLLLNKTPVGNTKTTAAKGVRAHQAFVVFRPQPATDAQAHLGPLVQPFQSTISGKHRISLIANRFARYFSRQPGLYDIEIILGVFGDIAPIRYSLGTIDFAFPLADPTDPAVIDDEAKRAKQRALEGPNDAEYQALPDIVHQFSKAEKMPPVMFSLGYSAIVLSPWLVLLGLWQWIGVKPNQLPKTTTAFVAHSLFFASISGFILLYAAYWVKLRLLHTLAYAVPLTIFTVLVGRVALSDVAHRRVQATKSE